MINLKGNLYALRKALSKNVSNISDFCILKPENEQCKVVHPNHFINRRRLL